MAPPVTLTAQPASAAFQQRRLRPRVSTTRCVAADAKSSSGKKGTVYVGKGRFLNDDPAKYPGRSADNMAGGCAGGEKGLWEFRDEIGGKPAGIQDDAKKGKGKGSSDISLAKDFSNMVGGFPGGEVGLKIFNATGEVPKTKPPTVGPVGRSLGILLPTYAALTLLTGEPDPRVWVAAVGELVPSTEQAAGGPGVEITLPSIDLAVVAPAAPYIALGVGVVAGGLAVRALASTVVDVASRSIPVVAVVAVAGAVAGKILNLW